MSKRSYGRRSRCTCGRTAPAATRAVVEASAKRGGSDRLGWPRRQAIAISGA